VVEHALHLVIEYGYLGIFFLLMLGIVGLPVPDEWLLLFAGFLVSRGDLHPMRTLMAAFTGSACGISLSYVIGRTLGLALVHRYGRRFHLGEDKLERVTTWYERVGKWSLLGGFFVPGVRHLTAILSGTAKLGWPTFAAFAYTGALVWTSTFLITGYVVGDQWRTIALRLRAHHNLLLVVMAAALAFYLLLRRWRRTKMGSGGRHRSSS
jgi:membrane protein DedA with SNARE-associated domain